MSAQLAYTQHLITQTCCTCGIEFGIPEPWNNKRREDHKEFYCPNGHVLTYRDGPLETLKKELADEKKRREWAEKNAEATRASNAALRGEMTKLKNRVGNGVCPCCKRSFTNLQRHMHSKHPEFKDGGEKETK